MHLPVCCLLLSIMVVHLVISKEVAAEEKGAEKADSLKANVEGKTLGVISPAYGLSYGGYGSQAPLQYVNPYQLQQQQLQAQQLQLQQFQPQFRQVARQQVPISIPYIDRNGCRFPGDVVCDRTSTSDPVVTFNYCILANEAKNLWKKPSMRITAAPITCANIIIGTATLPDFCNDNERILKAAGLIQDKTPASSLNSYHQLKYVPLLNPCILAA